PLLLAGLRVDGLHRPVADRVGPVVDRRRATDADAGRTRDRRQRRRPAAGEIAPGDVLRGFLAKDRRVAFPGGDIHEPRAWAERRGEPIRAALVAGPGRLAGWLRRRDRAAPGIEAAGPVHPDERCPEE